MASDKPNILVVLTDQQRLDTIRALSDENPFGVATPNMDRLVRDGISFTNCHCTAPVCSPSRSTLITGLHPWQAGMPGNLHTPGCPPLGHRHPLIGKMMRAAGYQTVYQGKWHLGGDIHDYGFEIADECSHDETTRLLASRFWKDRDWLEHDRPFFHMVSFLDPHDLYFYDTTEPVEGRKRPWKNLLRADDDYPSAARAKRVNWDEGRWGSYHQFYAERIQKVDRDIGLLMDELRCSGFYPNTWIIFASDHGDMAGEQNIPFKGSFMYEGVTKVPLILIPPRGHFLGDVTRSVPKREIPSGKRDALCSLLDVVPTVLDLAGVEKPESLPGTSLLPWCMADHDKDVHETVFSVWHQPRIHMARTTEWKYVAYQGGEEELFHLSQDPHETRNLAADPTHHPIKEQLKATLAKHLSS